MPDAPEPYAEVDPAVLASARRNEHAARSSAELNWLEKKMIHALLMMSVALVGPGARASEHGPSSGPNFIGTQSTPAQHPSLAVKIVTAVPGESVARLIITNTGSEAVHNVNAHVKWFVAPEAPTAAASANTTIPAIQPGQIVQLELSPTQATVPNAQRVVRVAVVGVRRDRLGRARR